MRAASQAKTGGRSWRPKPAAPCAWRRGMALPIAQELSLPGHKISASAVEKLGSSGARPNCPAYREIVDVFRMRRRRFVDNSGIKHATLGQPTERSAIDPHEIF